MPAAEMEFYYKCTRFGVPTATMLRFLVFRHVAHCVWLDV
jgi:hypothetical protein